MFEKLKKEAKEYMNSRYKALSLIFLIGTIAFLFNAYRINENIYLYMFGLVFALICLCFSVVYELAHHVHNLRIKTEIKYETKEK